MAEVVAISLQVDSGQSVQSVKKLEDAIKDVQKTTNSSNVEEKFNSLNQAIDKGEGSVEDLRKAIKSYQTIALSAGRTSPIGQEALKRSADLKDKLTDLDNEVNRLAQDGKTLQGAMQIGGGVVAGYQAFTGVTALLGVENEELMKTMVKLQASMSLLQSIEQLRLATEKESQAMLLIKNVRTKVAIGLQTAYAFAVGTGTKAMKLFRLALISTGLGALVVLIGVIIAKWDDWSDAIFKNSKEAKLRNEIQEEALKNSAEELNDLDKLQKKIKENVNDRSAQTKAIKEFQKTHPDLLQGLDSEGASYEDINKQIQANITLVKLKAESDALASIRTEKYKEKLEEQLDAQNGSNAGFVSTSKSLFTLRGAYSALTGNVLELSKQSILKANESSKEVIKTKEKEIDSLDKIDAEIQKKIEEAQSKIFKTKKKGSDKSIANKKKEKEQIEKEQAEELRLIQEALEKELSLINELEEAVIQSMQDEDAKKIALLKLQQERELEAVREKYGAETELEAQLLRNQNQELNNVKEEIRLANEEEDNIATNFFDEQKKEKRVIEIEEIKLSANDEIAILKEKLKQGLISEQEYADGIAKIEKQKEDVRNAGFKTAESIVGSLGSLMEGNEKAQKGVLAVQKAMTLAQIGIDTAKAISSLTAMSAGNPANAVTGGVAGVIQYATGIATILSNVAQAKKLLSGSGSGSVSAGGGSGVNPPSFNNQTNTQTGNSGGGGGNGTATGYIPTTKVVLVESELEAMQGRVKQVQQIATI